MHRWSLAVFCGMGKVGAPEILFTVDGYSALLILTCIIPPFLLSMIFPGALCFKTAEVQNSIGILMVRSHPRKPLVASSSFFGPKGQNLSWWNKVSLRPIFIHYRGLDTCYTLTRWCAQFFLECSSHRQSHPWHDLLSVVLLPVGWYFKILNLWDVKARHACASVHVSQHCF